RARSAPQRPSTRSPSNAYEPSVGESRQPRIAMSVDLPEPDGPIRARNSPGSTVRSIPRSARTATPLLPNVFVRDFVSMIGFIALVVLVVLLDLLLRRIFERDLVARPQPGEDLDAFERGDAGRDRDDVEVLLPVVGEPDERVAPREPLPRRRDLLRLQPLLQAVGDRVALLALEGFERDRDRLVALLAEDLDVRAHPGFKVLAELVQRDLDLEDLDLLDELGRGGDERDLSGEDLLRVRVERDADRLAHRDLCNVHLVQVDPQDERLQVRHGEEGGPLVERGDSGRHGLSELDALLDDHAVHGARDARSLRRRVARDRDAPVLDDLKAHLRGFDGLRREVALVLNLAQRVSADQARV